MSEENMDIDYMDIEGTNNPNTYIKIIDTNPKEGLYFLNMLDITNYEPDKNPLVISDIKRCSIKYGSKFDVSMYMLFKSMFLYGPYYITLHKLLPRYAYWKQLTCCAITKTNCPDNNINKIKYIDFLWKNDYIDEKEMNLDNKKIDILFRAYKINDKVPIKNNSYPGVRILNHKNFFYNFLRQNGGNNFLPNYWIIRLGNIKNGNEEKDFKNINENNINDLCNFYADEFINAILKIPDTDSIFNRMLLLKYPIGSLGNLIFGLFINKDDIETTKRNLINELVTYFSNKNNDFRKTTFFIDWQLSYYIKSISFDEEICKRVKIEMDINGNNILNKITDIPSFKVRYYFTLFFSNKMKFLIILHKVMDTDIIVNSVININDIYDRNKFISNINYNDIKSILFDNSIYTNNNNFRTYQTFLEKCFGIYCKTYFNICGNKYGYDIINENEKQLIEIFYNASTKLFGDGCPNNFENTEINNCFTIIAMDVIIDSELNIKILEINTNPVIQGGYSYVIGEDIYSILFEKIIVDEYRIFDNDNLRIIENDNYFIMGEKNNLEEMIRTTFIRENDFNFLTNFVPDFNIIFNSIYELRNYIDNIVIRDENGITIELINDIINRIKLLLSSFNLPRIIDYYNNLNKIYEKYLILFGSHYIYITKIASINLSNFKTETESLMNMFLKITDISLFIDNNENIKVKNILLNEINKHYTDKEKEYILNFINYYYSKIIELINMLTNVNIIRAIIDTNNNIIYHNYNANNLESINVFPSIYTIKIVNFLIRIKQLHIIQYNSLYNKYVKFLTSPDNYQYYIDLYAKGAIVAKIINE